MFRGWLFRLQVFIGQVDDTLVGELRKVLGKGHDDNWDPRLDSEIDDYIYEVLKGNSMVD